MQVIAKIPLSTRGLALCAGLLLSPVPVAAQVLGGDAEACRPDAPGPAALVHIHGFKDRAGRLRLQFYSGKPGEYLESGKYIRRIELPVTPEGDMTVCIVLPEPGAYAFVALHDRDADGRLSIWSDGIGFSRNPRLKLSKPKAEATVIATRPGIEPLTIVLNYRRGFSVRPLDE